MKKWLGLCLFSCGLLAGNQQAYLGIGLAVNEANGKKSFIYVYNIAHGSFAQKAGIKIKDKR